MGFICEVFQFIVFTRCFSNCLVLDNLALKLLEIFSSRYQLRQIIFSMSTFVPVRVLLSFDQRSFIETVARRMMQQIMDHKQEIPATTFNSMLRSFRPACEDVDK